MRRRSMNDIRTMYQMRLGGKTLAEVAREFGITKERVRQLLKSYGLKTAGCVSGYRRATILSSPKETNNELSKKVGLSASAVCHYRRGIRYETNRAGADVENYISDVLTKNKIPNKQMTHNFEYDILLADGTRIDVKSTSVSSKVSRFMKNPLFRFAVRKNVKPNSCDFFICVLPSMEFFVIPNSEIANVESVYISWPKPKRSWAKWHEYYNRLDLLDSTN